VRIFLFPKKPKARFQGFFGNKKSQHAKAWCNFSIAEAVLVGINEVNLENLKHNFSSLEKPPRAR